MERAKQVTMGELNASIGVRGLPPLPNSVCTTPIYFYFFFSFTNKKMNFIFIGLIFFNLIWFKLD